MSRKELIHDAMLHVFLTSEEFGGEFTVPDIQEDIHQIEEDLGKLYQSWRWLEEQRETVAKDNGPHANLVRKSYRGEQKLYYEDMFDVIMFAVTIYIQLQKFIRLVLKISHLQETDTFINTSELAAYIALRNRLYRILLPRLGSNLELLDNTEGIMQ